MFSRSSSSSTLSDSAKRHLLSCLPTDAKVLATASAKIYHAPFSSKADGWTYSGLSGTLVFGRDRTAVQADRNLGESLEQSFWFRLVDPTKGLVWVHQIPPTLDYALDKPFFHTFSGKSRMFGFRFDDDAEATKFMAKLTSHVRVQGTGGAGRRGKGRLEQLAFPPKRLSPAMVSPPAPGTFVHVAHVGINAQGGVEASDDVEPGWSMMLGEIQGYGPGISKKYNVPAVEAKPRGTVKKRSLGLRKPVFAFA